MKIRYMNGEKVYVHDVFKHDIRIYKHRDIIDILNKTLREAEQNPDDCGDRMNSLTSALEIHLRLAVEKLDGYETNIIFDDPKVRKTRSPKLYTGAQSNENLKVFHGGLYTPPEVKNADDILSVFFKEWRKKQGPGVTA